MIRTAVVGAARLLFNAALLAFLLGALLLYGAFRLLRSSVAKDRGQPVREAGFTALLAVVALAKAMKDQVPAAGFAPPPGFGQTDPVDAPVETVESL